MGARLVIMEHIVQKPVGIGTLMSNVRIFVNVAPIFLTILQDVKVRFNICYLIKYLVCLARPEGCHENCIR